MVFFWIIEGVATYCESFVCYYLGNTLFDNEGLRKHGWKLAAVLTFFILLLNHVRLFTVFTLLFAVLFVSLTEYIIFKIKTLIISKKPGNTGKSRDKDTEFTTHLLHSEGALTRCPFP